MRDPDAILAHRTARDPSGVDGIPLGLEPFPSDDEDSAFTPIVVALGILLLAIAGVGVYGIVSMVMAVMQWITR